MPKKLDGRVAVITGAARGIGRACAERFLRDGARVVLADVNVEELHSTVKAMGPADQVLGHPTDVGKRDQVESLLNATVKKFGRLDIWLNNAGVARNQQFLEISEEDYDAVLDINLKGAFFGTQAAGRQFIKQGTLGVIINMSSVNALLSIPTLATYAISKGGMNQITTIAAVAFAPYRIRVVGIGLVPSLPRWWHRRS